MVKIRSIDAIPVAIPLVRPVRLASEVIERAENLIVRVEDSDGVVGWGEAASAPTMTGERITGMVRAVVDEIAPRLIGMPIEDRDAWLKTTATARGHPGARAAVDVALHDLLGKRLGQSVSEIVDPGSARYVGRRLAWIETLSARDGAHALARAEIAAANGVTHFKVKVGQSPVLEEASFLRDLRLCIGDRAHLAADANMAWAFDEADRFLEAAAPAQLTYLEQPFPDGKIDVMAQLAKRHAVALCLDESLHGPADIEAHHSAQAATGVGLKLLKLGGFAGTLHVERLSRRCGWQTTYASKIAETSIGAAATIHAADAASDVSWGVSLTYPHLTLDPVHTSIAVDNGAVQAPNGPGLGVVVDEAKLVSVRLDM